MPERGLEKLRESVQKVRSEVEKVIVGQQGVVRYMLVTLFCGGQAHPVYAGPYAFGHYWH